MTGPLDQALTEPPGPARLNAGRLWAGGVATAIVAALVVVAAPVGQPAPLASKVFTAVVNLVAGVAVISLLTGVARGAVRSRPAPVAGPHMQLR